MRPEMGVSQELTPCSGGPSCCAIPRPVFRRLRHYREHECTEPDKLHNEARRMPVLTKRWIGRSIRPRVNPNPVGKPVVHVICTFPTRLLAPPRRWSYFAEQIIG